MEKIIVSRGNQTQTIITGDQSFYAALAMFGPPMFTYRRKMRNKHVFAAGGVISLGSLTPTLAEAHPVLSMPWDIDRPFIAEMAGGPTSMEIRIEGPWSFMNYLKTPNFTADLKSLNVQGQWFTYQEIENKWPSVFRQQIAIL